MKISNAGLSIIEVSEGLRLIPYDDSRGFATIGVGHLIRRGSVTVDDKPITKEEAYSLLRQDVTWAENAVNVAVKVPLNQNQFDALVSFTFNLGSGTLAHSDLLRDLNAGHYDLVPAHMLSYVRAGGTVLAGLVTRRHLEAALFNKTV